MKSAKVSGPGTSEVIEIERPKVRPSDVLVKIKPSGLCGSDAYFTKVGGIPPRAGAPSLGCGPVGEVVDVGAQVRDVAASDHVVINPMAAPDGIISSSGTLGALSEELVLKSAQAGVHFRIIPDEIPGEVAALNEPMAVVCHRFNRSGAGQGTKAVIFGGGPGLGAAIGLKSNDKCQVRVADRCRVNSVD